jgi:hypothetical protein
VLVTAIDGVRPRNFRHAVNLVERGKDEFLTLSLASAKTVVLSRTAVAARQGAILRRYRVPFDRSADPRATESRTAAKQDASAERGVAGGTGNARRDRASASRQH